MKSVLLVSCVYMIVMNMLGRYSIALWKRLSYDTKMVIVLLDVVCKTRCIVMYNDTS